MKRFRSAFLQFMVLWFVISGVQLYGAEAQFPGQPHTGYIGSKATGQDWPYNRLAADYLRLYGTQRSYYFLFSGTPTANRTYTLPDWSGTLMVSRGIVDASNSVWFDVSGNIVHEGATANAYEGTLTFPDVTADRAWTLPDATGTIALIDASQTLTKKELTSPVIPVIYASSNYSNAITLPTATGTAQVNCSSSHSFVDGSANWSIVSPYIACNSFTSTAASQSQNAVLSSCNAGQYYTYYNNSGSGNVFMVAGQAGGAVPTGYRGLFICSGTDVRRVTIFQ